jgi:hypothetical protein
MISKGGPGAAFLYLSGSIPKEGTEESINARAHKEKKGETFYKLLLIAIGIMKKIMHEEQVITDMNIKMILKNFACFFYLAALREIKPFAWRLPFHNSSPGPAPFGS